MSGGTRVQDVVIRLGASALSGLLAEPDEAPRGLILALHGGGARAAYWHSPVDPGAGLLELGARLGWRVLAVDRPGYGKSADPSRPGLSAQDQGAVLDEALAAVGEPGSPVVVAGHSLGAIVAARLAAAGRPRGLVAVALGGLPLAYTRAQAVRMARADVSGPVMRRAPGEARADPAIWFGPAGSWDPGLAQHRRELVTRTPTAEFLDAREAPSTLPGVLSRIAVPTQFAVAEHERTAASARVLLAAARRALPASGNDVFMVRDSGHNLFLGRAARGYHLRLLAFAEASLTVRINKSTLLLYLWQ
jgi:pimeloyl-ACP methyl ester carboxylesterase